MKVTTRNAELIRIPEAMRRLSCGRSTIYRLIADNKLVAVHVRGGRRIRVDSVDALAGGDAE